MLLNAAPPPGVTNSLGLVHTSADSCVFLQMKNAAVAILDRYGAAQGLLHTILLALSLWTRCSPSRSMPCGARTHPICINWVSKRKQSFSYSLRPLAMPCRRISPRMALFVEAALCKDTQKTRLFYKPYSYLKAVVSCGAEQWENLQQVCTFQHHIPHKRSKNAFSWAFQGPFIAQEISKEQISIVVWSSRKHCTHWSTRVAG